MSTPSRQARKAISSNKIVITDLAWTALFAQAAREGLVQANSDTLEDLRSFGSPESAKRVLSLLVLFEELFIPHQGQPESPRIPLLEQTDFFHPVTDTLTQAVSLGHGWANRNPEAWTHALKRAMAVEPFIIDRLLDNEALTKNVVVPQLLSREQYYIEIIRYAHAVYAGDNAALNDSILKNHLTETLLQKFQQVLLAKDADPAKMSYLELIVLIAVSGLDQLDLAQRLSTQFGAGATVKALPALNQTAPTQQNAADIADTFQIVETALHDETSYFPSVSTVEDALKLRKDPAIRSFREQLIRYQQLVYDGQLIDATNVRKDVKSAHQILAQKYQCDDALAMLTYVVLPVGVIEYFLGVPGITTTIIGTVAATATYTSRRDYEQNRWVLLGTEAKPK